MFQASVFMQQLAQILSCSRRNASGTRTNLKEAPSVASRKFEKKISASTGYRSNESTDLDSNASFVSTSGSEKETTSSRLRAQRSSNAKPPGLCSPRFRECPHGGQSTQRKRGADGEAKGFDSEVGAIFRKSLKQDHNLSECLREVTASSGNDVPSSLEEVLKRRLLREQSGVPEIGLPPSLQQVLGKLTREDAAIVKAAFQSKEASRATGAVARFANITEENTLRANLRKLASIDSKRVFMVRKISKLGLRSPELLKKYFSKFGSIENVFVTHSIDKRNANPHSPQAHIRAAGMGFIVMEKVEDVVNIFKQGLEHTVSGTLIAVTAYENFEPQGTAGNESKPGLPPSRGNTSMPRGPRFPSYANITEENTLRSNLQKMADLDASRIFMVRKISKLGLGSSQLLKTYFGQFGGVTNAFVTHSLDRRKVNKEDPNSKPAVKPAGLGFVVMDQAEDVAAIFRAGMEHTVYGVNICLTAYEHQIPDEASVHDNGSETPANDEELTC